ncbi:MAG: transglycosylase domain-containing protein [Candidatus Levybacteria bacterium]|nr:transglycosylase domain-containing protein [Candidatus Levybacteria bacterium]
MIGFGRPRSRLHRAFRNTSNLFILSKVAKFAFFGLIGLFLLAFVLFFWYSHDLPTPGKLSASNFSQATKIFDRNGILLYDIYRDENRTYITLNQIPQSLQEATIAIEDKDFYQNQGFSILGYLRAFRNAILSRRIAGGGSTLTQQLVKNTLLTSEQTIARKIKEFILAIQVDRKYTKDQILELYFNATPYGGTTVGVEAASERYFGKKAKDLNLTESIILAGLPQRPSFYSPYGQNPKAYIERSKEVLRRMQEDGYITKKQELETIKKLPTQEFLKETHAIKAPHFSFYVKDLLIKQFGENVVEQGGLQVTTTLDYKLQAKAEEIVKEEVDDAKSLKVGNGASVVLNPKNGEILSMVGSRDFFEESDTKSDNKSKETSQGGQFNVITQALRQPGSSIKPVAYATALEKGYTASSLIMDTKTVFPNPGQEKDYEPKNYDGKFHGPLQLRFALGSSINIPAVKLLALIGVKNMLSTAYNMGISTFAPTDENVNRFGLSLTLGGGDVKPLELASSYTAFANGGYRSDPISILKVTDPKGKVLFEQKEVNKKQVLSPEVAFIISHILLDNNARLLTFGPNSYLNTGKTISVKTGTTDDKRDNWTIGWTPSILVATWVGNNDNSEMGDVASGVTGAAPIWRRIILEALKDKPQEDFVKPSNVIAVTIDSLGGGLPIDGQPTRSEYFIKGTEPQRPSPIYKEIKVSKADSNKIASQSEIDKNEYEVKKFIVFTENDPTSGDGKNRWQEGIDAWINEFHKDDLLYHPPTEQSTRVITDTPTPTQTPSSTPTSILTPTPTT